MGKATPKKKAAQLLGSLGGIARSKKLTKEQRSEMARKAVNVRWAKKKGKEAK